MKERMPIWFQIVSVLTLIGVLFVAATLELADTALALRGEVPDMIVRFLPFPILFLSIRLVAQLIQHETKSTANWLAIFFMFTITVALVLAPFLFSPTVQRPRESSLISARNNL